MRADQVVLFVRRQNQIAILNQIALFAFTRFQGDIFRLAHAAAQKIDHRLRLRGRHEHIDVRQLLAQRQRVANADKTAHHADHFVRLFLLQFVEQPQPTECLIFGLLAHDTGVHDQNIRLIGVSRGAVAHALQFGGKKLRVSGVHLTAESPDVVLHKL